MSQKQKQILDILLNRYEQRGLYDAQTVEKARAVSLNVPKEFPEYKNGFLVEELASLDAAIEALIACGVLSGEKDARGMYGVLRLHIQAVNEAYRLAERTPVSSVRQREAVILRQFESGGGPVLLAFCRAQLERLSQNKVLAFGIGDDYIILQLILMALQAIERLEQETYIRNFSEAVFHDSKQFQNIRSKIERILYEFGDRQAEPRQILEQYNLFDNPAYIWVKGSLRISYPTGIIDVSAIPGGLALPSHSLERIQHIQVNDSKVITVENLTTYHDTDDSSGVICYLGGFLNQAR